VKQVGCSSVKRAVRKGANEANGKEQKPWHMQRHKHSDRSSARQATLGRKSNPGYAANWVKTSTPADSEAWKLNRWITG